jgi:RimJ/RimL family protein N-acetyltransferase
MADCYPRRLGTDRLRFEPLQEVDPWEYYRFRRDQPPEVYAHLPFDAFETPRAAADRLAAARENWTDRDRAMYALRPTEGEDAGALAGETMFATRWDRGVAWLGLVLGKRFWGRGYAGERADAMLELAFDRFDLEYVAVVHEVDNENSRRAVERYTGRHGGRREATLRRWSSPGSGSVPDEAYYAVSRAAWEDRR